MRHRKKRLQLNRFTSWHRATLRSLARNLLIHESIRTTKVKARAVKPLVEKLISMAKLNTLTAKRQAYKILGEHRLVSLLFNDIALRFKDKTSGYTRILNLTSRRGDGAELVIFELTEIKKKERIKPKKEGKEEIKTKEEIKPEVAKEKSPEEKKPKVQDQTKEKPPISKKPSKNFLGGLRSIFKKERDSL